MRAAALCLLLVGCGGAQPVPATGPCGVEQRAAIGATYEAELAADCHGGVCPHEAEISARYEAARKAWVACP